MHVNNDKNILTHLIITFNTKLLKMYLILKRMKKNSR